MPLRPSLGAEELLDLGFDVGLAEPVAGDDDLHGAVRAEPDQAVAVGLLEFGPGLLGVVEGGLEDLERRFAFVGGCQLANRG